MIQISEKDKTTNPPAQVPACWGWRKCPKKDGADKCASKLEACQPGRRVRFGDFHEPRPLTKDEILCTGVPGCANFRARGW